MIETVTRIICENCGKVIEVKGVIGDQSYWFLSNCRDIDHLDFQFCSLECLNAWAKEEIKNPRKPQEPF